MARFTFHILNLRAYFPSTERKKMARDVNGRVVGGVTCSEQQKLEFGTVIPTRSEGVTRGFGGE